MSDKAEGRSPQPDPAAPSTPAARLINPTVRNYMDALSLQRFYGGYQVEHIEEHVFNLGIGEVGNIPLPQDLYTVYTQFIQSESRAALALRYSGTLGERETNRLVAEEWNRWLGDDRFDDNRVVSLDGGQNAVEVAVRAFTTPLGSRESRKQYVLLGTPSYPYFSAIIAAHAGIQSFLAYDAESFTRGMETYANPSVGMILVNVPNNPMGYVLSAEQVERINRVAAAYDCAILVDGVYANYPDDPGIGHALAGFDPDRTVFADSFSKKYGLPGLRLGFALSTAKELTYAMRFIKMAESLTPSNLKLAFAGHLLDQYADYPRRIGAEVRARRARFLERFKLPSGTGVQMAREHGNPFYLTLDIAGLSTRTGMNDAEVTRYCREQYNVRVFPGTFVYPSASLRHGTFTIPGRHDPHGMKPYLPPGFAAGEQIIYAPDAVSGRIPLLRLSFGTEPRIEAAAEALMGALTTLGTPGG